ncbi:alpha helical protein [Mycolicibacterium sp. P1-18]|nr:alpha helical protein [Mycolicibacterium sp. P1-18]
MSSTYPGNRPHCARRGDKVSVKQGDRIPKCPTRYAKFDARTGQPGDRS